MENDTHTERILHTCIVPPMHFVSLCKIFLVCIPLVCKYSICGICGMCCATLTIYKFFVCMNYICISVSTENCCALSLDKISRESKLVTGTFLGQGNSVLVSWKQSLSKNRGKIVYIRSFQTRLARLLCTGPSIITIT